MKININQEIKVKLTQEGHNVLKQHYDNIFCYPNPQNQKIAQEAYQQQSKTDKDGQITIQLWVFMSIFGPKLYNGGPQLIQENNIHITQTG